MRSRAASSSLTRGGDRLVDPGRDLRHVLLGEAPRGQRRRCPAGCRTGRTACAGRTARCCSSSSMPARSSALAAGLPPMPLPVRSMQDQVVVGAAGDQVEAALDQRGGERLGVRDDLVGVRLELRLGRPPAARPRCRRWCGCAGRPAGRGRPPCRSRWRAPRCVMIIAPRGPRSVLCVVVVITSAWPTGDGCAPPAIRPAMCAMSATRIAPDLARDLGEAPGSRWCAGSPCRRRRSPSGAPAARGRGPRPGRSGRSRGDTP